MPPQCLSDSSGPESKSQPSSRRHSIAVPEPAATFLFLRQRQSRNCVSSELRLTRKMAHGQRWTSRFRKLPQGRDLRLVQMTQIEPDLEKGRLSLDEVSSFCRTLLNCQRVVECRLAPW